MSNRVPNSVLQEARNHLIAARNLLARHKKTESGYKAALPYVVEMEIELIDRTMDRIDDLSKVLRRGYK